MELLVLRRLKDRFSFDCGLHSESALFSTLLSLILFDEIVSIPIEGVFQSKYQNGPLDFYTSDFYKNRKEKIDSKFKLLTDDGFDDVIIQMENVWNTISKSSELCGILHSPQTTEWSNIKSLCQCLGGKTLSKILMRICRNPAHRSGIPDLIGR